MARILAARAQAAGPGARLPGSRALIREFAVSATTIQQALDRLVQDGVVVTRPGAGTFVAARREPEPSDTRWQDVTLQASPVDTTGLDLALRTGEPDLLPMAVGYPSSDLGGDLPLSAALARAARRPGVWDPPPVLGLPSLRSWFGQQIGVSPDNIIVTPGTQSALSTIFRAIVPAGESILFATPTYPGALAIARSAGQVAVPVPGDEDGLRPDLLERALERTQARVLYLQPTFANPDGNVLSAERRRKVLDVAARHGLFVVEDDWARWLGHGDPIPPPLIRDDPNGHVITVCSLTKAGAPGLRIGAIAARGQVAARLAALRMVDDFFVSGPLQHAAIDVVTSTAWAGHVRRTAAALGARVNRLTAELRSALPDFTFVPPRGGLSIWLELPAGLDEDALVRAAREQGLAVGPGRDYSIGDHPSGHLRLSFANLTEHQLPDAVARLGAARAAVQA
ncbi:DNA-binding transcriptional regulator, MocR family, contains an aminotransferase domain [Nakamurella panacisegetis]|uniref:DNA-binding transcriptional regulator, MocR family, contains an aminotransferase domain n=1 Tax=Nakamurella panacisegetis TaxID=1090615 RepID=A0A1H0I5A4_9ACTN|nr:DNA-binding transcriptional regulator, MocR family, contains an aminotransferase domain [Nakamurella panacisegetis]